LPTKKKEVEYMRIEFKFDKAKFERELKREIKKAEREIERDIKREMRRSR